ncbi:MAG: hypothetical protein D4R44_08135 [Actinobacteria bacterium]|nr:MAG: hypothetical protein D4R44_08135 [Actinomycetota bacterium]
MPVIGVASTSTGLTTAGSLVTAIRDLIPDPVYDTSNVALPDTDGNLIRSQSLYRWISNGIILVSQKLGWVIEDWNGLVMKQDQPFYALDPLWHNINDAWLAGFVMNRAPEAAVIFPYKISSNRSYLYGLHKRTDHLEVFLFAKPNTTDPTTTLTNTIGADGVDPIIVGSTTGFLAYGMVRIEDELIQYQTLTGGLAVVSRGVGATKAVAHNAGATVSHCNMWMKGVRLPRTITQSSDVIEIPAAFIPIVQEYVLQQVRVTEQEYQLAGQHQKTFNDMLAEADNDPIWKSDLYTQQGLWDQYGTRRGRWWPVIIP